jgi:hypothetical protein
LWLRRYKRSIAIWSHAIATGSPFTVRYDAVNAMLLKEHCKVEQLTKDFESQLVEQQKQIEALTAGLQKVSDQLELSEPAPQIVVDKQ